jgi:hypothetical protein
MIGMGLLGRYAATESDASARDLDIRAPVEGVDSTGAQLDGESLVENELIDAGRELDEVRAADGEAGELEDTAEALESYLIAASYGRKQGGWSQPEAMAYGLGIEIALRRIGINDSNTLPALESFKEGQREQQTAAVENALKDAIYAIWEAVKRVVNKVVVFVRKWYIKIVDAASRMKKRAIAIRTRAENTTGTRKEAKIRTASLSMLHINKNMPTAKVIAETIQKIGEDVKTLTNNRAESGYSTNLETFIKTLTDMAESDGSLDQTAANAAITSILSSKLFEVNLGLTTQNGSAADIGRVTMVASSQNDSVDMKKSNELLGGRMLAYLTISSPKGTIENGQLGRNFASAMRIAGKVTLSEYSTTKVEIDSTKEVATLDPSQVVGICDAVVDYCDAVIDYRMAFEKYSRANTTAMGKIENVLRRADVSDAKENRSRAEFMRGLASGVGSMIRNRGTSITELISYGASVSRAALNYSVQSLGQYKD